MPRSWMSEQAEMCSKVAELSAKYSVVPLVASVSAESIIGALNQFQECVRYLNTRRSAGAILNLNSEANVQDAVYLMLRPWVHDLASENPTNRLANRFAIKDFISPGAETVIEIKYVRDQTHGKSISSEMHDDIEMYRHHPRCRTLVFFVYDPESLIPDGEALRSQIETERVYGGIPLKCVLIIKP